MQQACDNYRRYLETLRPETLPELLKYVSADVHFQDPLNDVHGIDAMAEIFHHMFESVGPVQFTASQAQAAGRVGLFSWRFEGQLFGKPWVFNGTSVITFDEDGMVIVHIDHWDAAQNFYERLPLIGWLFAWLRRRLARQ